MLGMGALHTLYEGAKRPGLSGTIMEMKRENYMHRDGKKTETRILSSPIPAFPLMLYLYKNICGNTGMGEDNNYSSCYCPFSIPTLCI